MSTNWKYTNHNSILVIVDRLTKMVHYEPMQITINAPAPAVGYMPFELDYGYHPCAAYQEDRDLYSKSSWWASCLSYKSHECIKNLPHGLSKSLSAGPLGLRAWIWLSPYPVTSSIALFAYYDPLKVWQISLHRTLWGFEHRFGHKLRIKSKYHKGAMSISYVPGNNIYSWRLSVSVGAKPTGRGGCTKPLQDVRKRYKMYENAVFENVTRTQRS